MYSYKHIKGCDIGVDVFEAQKMPAPLLLMIHGGGFVFGSRKDISKHKMNAFLERGIHVASIDYRLSPESSFSDALIDVEDAIRWIHDHVKKTGINVTRFFVMGYSAGGFLAYHAGTLTPKPDGIISMYGYADLSEAWCNQVSPYYLSKTRIEYKMVSSLIGTSPISSPPPHRFLYYLYLRQQGKWMQTLFKTNALNDEALKEMSPLYKIMADYPKTLIIHGKLDQDVPIEAALNVIQRLEAFRVPYKSLLIDHAEHDFDTSLDDETTRGVYDAIVQFIKGQEADKF